MFFYLLLQYTGYVRSSVLIRIIDMIINTIRISLICNKSVTTENFAFFELLVNMSAGKSLAQPGRKQATRRFKYDRD